MVMRRRITEIVADYSISSAGEVKTADLPNDFSTSLLAITFKCVAVTDEPTYAEMVANITTLEITTRTGSPIKISGADLYAFNKDFYGRPGLITNLGVATDNYIKYITFLYPLNPTGLWNGLMGINPSELGKVRVTAGTDTAAGADARTLTVTAIGVEGVSPATFMAMYQDSFTAVVGDNFRDIQQEKVIGMAGIYVFATTGLEDLTTTDAPGLNKLGYAISQTVKERIRNHVMLSLMQPATAHMVTDITAAMIDTDYVFFDLGAKEGSYIPYVDKLQVYISAGVAEAMRVYPLLIVRNN